MSAAETGIADDTDGFPRRLLSTDPMNREEAEAITHAIRTRATRLCQMVKEAHDGQAWKAMEYESFAAYCDTEFNIGKSQAYRLIGHALTLEDLADAAGLPADSPMGENLSERKLRALPMPAVAEAVREAVMDLAPDATTADRLAAVETTVAKIAATVPPKKPRKPKPSAGAQDPAPVAPVEPPAANDDAIAPVVDTVRAEQAASEPAQADPAPVHPSATGAGSAIPPTAGAVAAKVRTWRAVAGSSTSAAVLAKNLREACDLIDKLTKGGAA